MHNPLASPPSTLQRRRPKLDSPKPPLGMSRRCSSTNSKSQRLQLHIPESSTDHFARRRHPMFLIISVANSLHFTFFAPSISRAKSYVTVLLPIVLPRHFVIMSAASCHFMYSSIITPERITLPGLTTS